MSISRQLGSEERTQEALGRHVDVFHDRFGTASGVRCFFSPGRVNLMGAHLDYCGGPVMPTAIDRGTFLAVRPRTDRLLRLASTLDGPGQAEIELDLATLPAARLGSWADYPLGVVHELLAGAHAVSGERTTSLCGLDVLYGGNLRVGAGLSSSASICVGTAHALGEVWRLALERMDVVEAALAAERGFVGVQCGIMDPFAVGLARPGHLLWLDCKDRTYEHLPLDSSRLCIAVADTLVRRELARSAFNERVRESQAAFDVLRAFAPEATCLRDVPMETFECERGRMDPVLARRTEHVLGEVQRTFAARTALERGDPETFGAQMVRAHASLRDLYEVSVPELDQLVDTAVATPGVLGTRLTGAGFGGCVVVLLEKGSGGPLRARLESEFAARFGYTPEVEFFGGDAGPRELFGDWD